MDYRQFLDKEGLERFNHLINKRFQGRLKYVGEFELTSDFVNFNTIVPAHVGDVYLAKAGNVDSITFGEIEIKDGDWFVVMNESRFDKTDPTIILVHDNDETAAWESGDVRVEKLGSQMEDNPTDGYYTAINKLTDYAYEIYYTDLNYQYAKREFEKNIVPTGCSSVRVGNMYGRNLDWIYNEDAEFIVHTPSAGGRFATLGTCGQISKLSNAFVESGEYAPEYILLPFYCVDGINEKGVFINVNVVPVDTTNTEPFIGPAIDTEPSIEICANMIPRYVLDYCDSATAAVELIRDHMKVYFSQKLRGMGYEPHFMVGDATNTYIVEFVGNACSILNCDVGGSSNVAGRSYMTNFHLTGVTMNASGEPLQTPATRDTGLPSVTNNMETYGAGLERYNLISNAVASGASVGDIMYSLRYTRAYSADTDPMWHTEFVGSDDTTVDSAEADFAGVESRARARFAQRSRNPEETEKYGTWQTTHSIVYNIDTKSAVIHFQEDFSSDFVAKLITTSAEMIINVDVLVDASGANENAIYRVGTNMVQPYGSYWVAYNGEWRRIDMEVDDKTIKTTKNKIETVVGGWREDEFSPITNDIASSAVEIEGKVTAIAVDAIDPNAIGFIPNTVYAIDIECGTYHYRFTQEYKDGMSGLAIDGEQIGLALKSSATLIATTAAPSKYTLVFDASAYTPLYGEGEDWTSGRKKLTVSAADSTYHKSDARYIDIDGKTIQLNEDLQLEAGVMFDVNELPTEDILDNVIYRVGSVMATTPVKYGLTDACVTKGYTMDAIGIKSSSGEYLYKWDRTTTDVQYITYYYETMEMIDGVLTPVPHNDPMLTQKASATSNYVTKFTLTDGSGFKYLFESLLTQVNRTQLYFHKDEEWHIMFDTEKDVAVGSINGVEMSGEQTTESLKIALAISEDVYESKGTSVLDDDIIYLVSDGSIQADAKTDYEDYDNKPAINGVELHNYTSYDDIGVYSKVKMDELIHNVFRLMGQKNTKDDLLTETTAHPGDMWYVLDEAVYYFLTDVRGWKPITNDPSIGDLSTLQTLNKSNLVDAINEIKSTAVLLDGETVVRNGSEQLQSFAIIDITSFPTENIKSHTLYRIREGETFSLYQYFSNHWFKLAAYDSVGNVEELTTTAKNNVVSAINEVNDRIHISSTIPTDADGQDGDVWFVYEP